MNEVCEAKEEEISKVEDEDEDDNELWVNI